MNGHPETATLLHWFWTGFFALFAVFLITRWDGSVRGFAASRATCGQGDLRERLDAAVERRQQAEGTPAPLGIWAGIPVALLAIAAAFTSIPVALLYALLCLFVAAANAVGFLRLRNSQPKRVAVLAVRNADSVIPGYWFAVAILCALSVLAFAGRPDQTASAIVVCFSSLASAAIAWRLTRLPALLSGVDVEAEQIVDERVRLFRSAATFFYALAQTFVFCTQAAAASNVSTLQIAVYWLNVLPWIAFGIWMVRKRFTPLKRAAA